MANPNQSLLKFRWTGLAHDGITPVGGYADTAQECREAAGALSALTCDIVANPALQSVAEIQESTAGSIINFIVKNYPDWIEEGKTALHAVEAILSLFHRHGIIPATPPASEATPDNPPPQP